MERRPANPFRHLLRGRRQIRDELDEEIAFHLEMRAADLRRGGIEPTLAREEALRRFGDLEETRRACAEADRRAEQGRHRRRWIRETRQDLLHGVRNLRHRPLFAGAAIVTLAVGIGATTAIFSAADHVLLRPLPYADPERGVALWETDRGTGEKAREVSPGNFLAWQARSRAFAALGLAEPSGASLTGNGPPLSLPSWDVTEHFFDALGVRPLLGPGFEPEDHLPDAAPVVMISHGLWRRRYGADPAVVGRRIQLDGAPATVVGVLPPGAEYPEPKDLWTPKSFREDELQDHASSYMRAVGRLRPGVTMAAARRDLERIAGELAAEHPATNLETGFRIVPLEEQVLGPVRPALLVLLAAVGFLLLIACANVASLLLAAAAERERELGVRAALGAGRARLARQLAAESALLGAIGGGVGLALAAAGVRVLARLSPPEIPRIDTVALDGRALAFACAVTLLTTLVFGIAPALRFSRPNVAAALRSEGRASTAGAGHSRLRSALVVTEIALALVLLVGAGLLVRSFASLADNDLGFTVERRVALQVFLWDRNPTAEQRLQRIRQISDRFTAVPGVAGVAVTSALPFHPSGHDGRDPLLIHGRPTHPGQEPQAHTAVASPRFFALLGVPLLRGRDFTALDRDGAPAVAIVNETLARSFFPGEDPLGRRVTIGVMDEPVEREIVGVVGAVRPRTLESEPRPELYVPLAQSGTGSVTFVVLTRSDPAELIPVLRRRLWEVDPGQPIYHTATLERLVSDTLLERRFHVILLAAFSAVALALAAVGIYGLVSFTTARRRRELGVRLALGARPGEVVGLVVREGLALGVPGVLLGLAGALALSRFLAGMLYGVRPTDPLTYLQVAGLMLLVAVLGAWIPARRVVASDPVRALRQE